VVTSVSSIDGSAVVVEQTGQHHRDTSQYSSNVTHRSLNATYEYPLSKGM
jgi:hypothetical protein